MCRLLLPLKKAQHNNAETIETTTQCAHIFYESFLKIYASIHVFLIKTLRSKHQNNTLIRLKHTMLKYAESRASLCQHMMPNRFAEGKPVDLKKTTRAAD
jgi:hypothetical protein